MQVREVGFIHSDKVSQFAAALDLPSGGEPRDSTVVPPMWHWLFLAPFPRRRELGADGHAATGLTIPEVVGQRRMFAGGSTVLHAPLRAGRDAERHATVVDVVRKQGRSGPLTFVTLALEIWQDGTLRIEERQDLVYRPHASSQLSQPGVSPAPSGPSLRIDVDEPLLFRFSALTNNAHRIHYDLRWARSEGYADLVVHGPLQVILMAEFFHQQGVDLTGSEFNYRLLAPAVGPQTLTITGEPAADHLSARVLDQQGVRCAVAHTTGGDRRSPIHEVSSETGAQQREPHREQP